MDGANRRAARRLAPRPARLAAPRPRRHGLDQRNVALTFTADAVTAAGGPAWLQERRHGAFDRFEAAPLPTAALEEWRYSRIDQLDLGRYRPLIGPSAAPELPVDLSALVDRMGPAAVVVVGNGRAARVAVAHPDVAFDLGDGGEAAPFDAVLSRPDAFTFLNAAFASPLTVTVAPGIKLAGPVVVVHWLDTEGSATFPLTRLTAGVGAEVEVVEMLASADVDALCVPVTEIEVGPGAVARYVHYQQLGPRLWQLGLQASRVGRDATLTAGAIAVGGDYSRLRIESSLVGQGGTTRLLAVYFGAGHRMVDFRTTQDHQAPKTTSELLFKGAVANRSQAVYTGLIRVEKGARGTNAFQTNRNLVLHEGARADSVPNLEIEDNDVRCSHASAVGPIAADQRFYLESRGVPPHAADRLITLGFLDEVLERMANPALVDHVRLELLSLLEEAERHEAAAGGER